MKKLLSVLFISTAVLTSCGPAAEDRVQMDRIAKRMSDSIYNLVDSSLNDPLKYVNLNTPSMPPPQPVATQTAGAPTTTVK